MYSTQFGLQEEPFRLTSDPRFFYSNAVYQEAYASLVYGIEQRKGLVVLTGETGTGKTTLLKVLMNHLEAQIRWIYIGQAIPTFEELLDFICRELQLSLANAGQLQKIQALHDYLLNQFQHGGSTVLIIDEAQSLGEGNLEQLRMLLNLETETDKLLQILLVGQPTLESQLEQPSLYQLKQRIALWRRLTRLSDRDVGNYIAHRLQVAGYHRRGLFTSGAIQRIAQYADGIPRLIHILCDNALLNAYGASQKTVTAEIVDEVAADHQLAALPAAPAASSQQQPQRLRDVTPEDKNIRSTASAWPTRQRFAWSAAALVVLVLIGLGTSYALPLTVGTLVEIVLERLEQLKTLSSSFWNVGN